MTQWYVKNPGGIVLYNTEQAAQQAAAQYGWSLEWGMANLMPSERRPEAPSEDYGHGESCECISCNILNRRGW